MLRIKYRIKRLDFPNIGQVVFVAQYRILIWWLNIDDRLIGNFTTNQHCYCENYVDTVNRIDRHKVNSKIASQWTNKTVNYLDYEN